MKVMVIPTETIPKDLGKKLAEREIMCHNGTK